MSKLGRNDPCYCGSGKKYKHCCLGKTPRPVATADSALADAQPYSHPSGVPYVDDGLDEVVQDLIEEAEQRTADTPLDRAYDLAADAWDAVGRERVDLARRALAESPDCVDAYNALAAEAATPQEAIVLYEQALAAADRVLGTDWWQLHPIRDWTEPLAVEDVLDTRRGLARAYMELGRDEEAVEQLRTVMAFDPEDYDAVRYDYLEALLRADRDDEAMELLHTHAASLSALWPYARALLTYRRDGDTLWARRALVDALAANPVAAVHLLGKQLPPELAMPAETGLFDPNVDAAGTADRLTDVWQRTPGAMEWLQTFFDAGPDAHLDDVERGDGPVLCLTPTDVVAYVRCPHCDRKTKPRKRDVAVLVEPDDLVVARLSCRHCEDCNVLSILTRDVDKGAKAVAKSRGLDIAGRDYVLLGIVDPQVAEQRPTGSQDATWAHEHLRRWSDEIRLLEELREQLGLDDFDDVDDGDGEGVTDDAGVIDVPYSLRPS
ncbi:MAG TPA: SEC-C metal-binding domain-containing protein [Thermomicrobiales bacterium]|jgi:tetratricopeptide (TPR) repeat protein